MYTDRRLVSERLVEITREMEVIAREGGAFRDDPRFSKLDAEYRATLQNLLSLE
jgi:hypothetical protein